MALWFQRRRIVVFPIVSLWELSVAMETTILIQSAPKSNAVNPVNIKFDQMGPLGSEIFFFEIVDGLMTTTDAGCLPIL